MIIRSNSSHVGPWPFIGRAMARQLAVAALLAITVGAAADFTVANTGEVESRPAVGYYSQTGEFFVVYLEKQSGYPGQPVELRMRRFDENGYQQGAVLQPYGAGSHVALGRPAIGYSETDDRMFVAVPVYDNQRLEEVVLARYFNPDGSSAGPVEFLFSGLGTYDDGQIDDGNGSLQVTWNSMLNEFVVTVQWTVSGNNRVYGQRVGPSGIIGSPVMLRDHGLGGQNSHDIEYAPLTTIPAGGRYLFISNGTWGTFRALDVNLGVVTTIPSTDWGTPNGNAHHHNIAYGRVQGKDRWLIVWADQDNCWPGHTTCTNPDYQWTGVWGTYIDPADPAAANNTPFPISKIPYHIAVNNLFMPRVAYNKNAETFYVAWRELPVMHPDNDQSLSHIRGNWVDYFVDNGVPGALVPLPYDNTVLTYVTGSCTAGSACFSEQDPMFPDVAANKGWGGVAVWHEKYAPDPADLDLYGERLDPPAPANDTKSSPLVFTPSNPTYEVSLVGSGSDGSADCGGSADEPDVWFLYEATATGVFITGTCGSNDLYGEDTGMDTVLSLHEPDGTQIAGACNDDYPDSLPDACAAVDFGAPRDSALALPMHVGDTILVRVSRYGGSYGGRFNIGYGFEPAPDSDGDGHADPDDNCVDRPNPAQRDSDGDNIGNFCDADLDGNCMVNAVDLGLFKAEFFTSDPHADFNGDGVVNVIDLGLMKSLFFMPPGPSGLPNACQP